MSYNPETDLEKEFPRQAALRKRFAAFAKDRPIALAFRIWLGLTLFSALMLTLDGLAAFDSPGRKLILLFALLGWIIPFVDWIRTRKAIDE